MVNESHQHHPTLPRCKPQRYLNEEILIRLLLHRLQGVASLKSMKWVPVLPLKRNDLESSYFHSYDR